jgi:hypothetical protein
MPRREVVVCARVGDQAVTVTVALPLKPEFRGTGHGCIPSKSEIIKSSLISAAAAAAVSL